MIKRRASLDDIVLALMPDGANLPFFEVWWSQDSKVLSLRDGSGFWQLWLDAGTREHDAWQPGGAEPVQLW